MGEGVRAPGVASHIVLVLSAAVLELGLAE